MNDDAPEGTVETFDFEQGGDDWIAARLGIPTASRFSDVMAGGRGGAEGLSRLKYLRQLAGERITGIQMETFRSKAMERGTIMEPEIRSQYALLTNTTPEPVGFVRRRLKNGWVGSSPDSFVGKDLTVEYKSLEPSALIELYETDRTPPEHIAQCQGTMMVTGRPRCELVIGYGSMPLWRKLIPRDPVYQARLVIGLEAFNEELDALVAKIETYGHRR